MEGAGDENSEARKLGVGLDRKRVWVHTEMGRPW